MTGKAQLHKSHLICASPHTKTASSFPYDQIPLLVSGQAGYYAFLLPEDDRPHGYIAPSVVDQMPWTPDFAIDTTSQPRRVTLLDTSKGTDTAAACNASFRTLIKAAQDKGVFARTLGRKAEGEDFRIMAARNYQGKRTLVQLRRSAAPLFGIANRGAHMTVYTKSAEGKYRIWVPRRSQNCRTYRGMLDNTVAGGVKAEEVSPSCFVLFFLLLFFLFSACFSDSSRPRQPNRACPLQDLISDKQNGLIVAPRMHHPRSR